MNNGLGSTHPTDSLLPITKVSYRPHFHFSAQGDSGLGSEFAMDMSVEDGMEYDYLDDDEE